MKTWGKSFKQGGVLQQQIIVRAWEEIPQARCVLSFLPLKFLLVFLSSSSSFSFVSVWFWAPPSPLSPAHNVWSYCIANPGDFQLDCRATWVFVNGVPAGMANARCCDEHNASSSSQSKRRFNPPPPKKRSPPWFGICVRSLAVQESGIKLFFNPNHVLVFVCSNKYIPGWLVGFCNAIFFLGLVGNTAWQKEMGN